MTFLPGLVVALWRAAAEGSASGGDPSVARQRQAVHRCTPGDCEATKGLPEVKGLLRVQIYLLSTQRRDQKVWWPHASAVVRIPNTRKGCAFAW